MAIIERVRDAYSTLFGLKRAAQAPQTKIPQRVGSPPDVAAALMAASPSYDYYRNYTHLEPHREQVYTDMDDMFQYVLASSSLDAYCEDATQPDSKSDKVVWVSSPSTRVTVELTRLFEILELDDTCYGLMWSLAKYGDLFGLVQYEKERGVFDLLPLEPRVVHRIESAGRSLMGFAVGEVQGAEADIESGMEPQLQPWDIVRWRIRTQRPTHKYGTPFFYNVRLIYKTLKLMEEQMTIYRMNLHPDRLIFKIFTGNSSPDESFRIIRNWRKAMERIISLNPQGSEFRSEYAPWAIDPNIYWPVGFNDNSSGIDKFPGSANSGDIFDIEYVRDLFFAGTRVPKGYMGFEDSQGYRSEDTLSQQSVKFARGVKRIRHFFLAGVVRLCKIHLELRGINTKSPANSFELRMAPVSYLDESHKAELYAKRFESVRYMMEIGEQMEQAFSINKQAWAAYVLSEFAGLEPEMVSKLLVPVGDKNKPDLTFTPSGSRMVFEGLSADDQTALRERMESDPELKSLVEKIVPVESLTSETRMRSDGKPVSLGKSLKPREEATTTRIIVASGAMEEQVARERKTRMKTELRALAEEAQKSAA